MADGKLTHFSIMYWARRIALEADLCLLRRVISKMDAIRRGGERGTLVVRTATGDAIDEEAIRREIVEDHAMLNRLSASRRKEGDAKH